MSIKLKARDSAILAHIQHRASQPLSTLAKDLGLKEATLRYSVQSLMERGILLGAVPRLNLALLGYTNYTLLFSLGASNKEQRERFFQCLADSPKTSWVGRLSGQYQICAVITAQGPEDLNRVFDEVTAEHCPIILEKCVAIKTSFTDYGRSFFDPQITSPEFHYEATNARVKVDALEVRILQAMLQEKTISLRQLERSLEVPFSTIRRRVSKLEQAGVIVGYEYELNLKKCGLKEYSLLISSSNADENFAAELRNFCRKDPQIRAFIRSFGPWDYEVLLSTPMSFSIGQIVDRIYENFGERIQRTALLEVFAEGKVNALPIEAQETRHATLAA